MSNHRSRALLNLAHRVTECQNCGRYTEGCEPAHQNGQEGGKGIAVKGADHRHAALCHDCHAWLDQGGKASLCGQWRATRDDKHTMWIRAHLRTYDYYWGQGWLKVA